MLVSGRCYGFLPTVLLNFSACYSGGNMSGAGRTFSESWHRVAGIRVNLRPTVKVRRQFFRGEKWYVLYDPFNNHFFRLRPEAYAFVCRLRPDMTVEETWEDCLEADPDKAPGQEDVVHLLTQLHFASLLYYENSSDTEKLFQRFEKKKRREFRSRIFSIMFMRIPLVDPDRFLQQMMPVSRKLISYAGAFVWAATILWALKIVFANFSLVQQQAQGVLSPDNLILLYVGLVFTKILHELGHAVVCRRFGGEVHTLGVMLLVFTPLPYMDATASWSFRSRKKRVLVGAAGMLTELFVAALATFVWANSGAGVLHGLAYNIMFIASVSTLIFNINPLLRFDGYYILSDLLDIPNLHTRAKLFLTHIIEYYCFGCQTSISPAKSRREAWILAIFGVLSFIYRVIVFTGIIFFVADKFLLAGLIMALFCVIAWGIIPPFKLINYLATSPKLVRTRARAISVCSLFLLILILLLAVFPFPHRFRAPGILESADYLQVVNDAPGYVSKVLVSSGTEVEEGISLLELVDEGVVLELESARAQWQEVLALEQKAESGQLADRQPIRKRKETIAQKLKDLAAQQESLIVKARQLGLWVAPQIHDMSGVWLQRGSVVGMIVQPRQFKFSAVVSQEVASNLFTETISKAEVRLYGQAGENIEVLDLQFIPFEHRQLPSAALGWMGGGEVAVSLSDESGVKATEPFFQIYADLESKPEVTFRHGRAGRIRLTMPPKPLLFQWAIKLRKVLQKRYMI